MGHYLKFIALLFVLNLPAAFGISPAEIRKSLVRISTTSQDPNYRVPWMPGKTSQGTGAGFIIEGKRILTNAHVVSNARFVSLERENDPRRYIARVQFIAHDCDLAVLSVEDPAFFKDTKPLPFSNKIPQIESSVSVYGYPIGGKRLSVTTGVVSRIDFQTYSHTLLDAHLVIQTNAAINPGNSGGPVLQDGKVVGVAFQGYSGDVAQNTGYMIPVPVINRFLTDIKDGRYDRYMDLSITTFPLLNPAHRRALGLPADDVGVVVGAVAAGGACDGILQVGDVILKIDGHTVGCDGFIEIDGLRIEMPEIVERKLKGDTVVLDIVRNKQPKQVTVKFEHAWPYGIQANQYETPARYVLFGGLLFQPLNRDFMDAYQVDDLRLRYLFNNYVTDEIYKERPEIIVLSAILPDPINTYLNDFRLSVVDEVNGKKIRTLNDLADAFAEPAEDYIIKVMGEGRPIVLARSAVESARERIKRRYSVFAEQNLELPAQ